MFLLRMGFPLPCARLAIGQRCISKCFATVQNRNRATSLCVITQADSSAWHLALDGLVGLLADSRSCQVVLDLELASVCKF